MTGPDDEALAAEYALGVLDGPAREAAERRVIAEPDFAREVAFWRLRLAELDAAAPQLPVPAGLWERIDKTLNYVQAEALRPPLQTFWSSLAFWRWAGFSGAAAALILLLVLGVRQAQWDRTPVMIAVLATDTSQPGAVVNVYRDGRTELVPLTQINVPEGRALEIWTLWDRGVGPRSVGLIDRARATRLRVQDLPLGPDQLFEITLEPATGSPTGRPTGPILMKGTTSTAL